MMNHPRIYSIHEQVITIEFAQEISEEIHTRVLSLHRAIITEPFNGLIEIVPAFASLTIYFSQVITKEELIDILRKKINNPLSLHDTNQTQTKVIPVCYEPEFGIDLDAVSAQTGLGTSEIISLHTSQNYRVYMIGFMPGFPYLGILPNALEIPRKKTPSLHIPAGSVAIAGKQTGIYPSSSPGGWHVIGRTPIKMFDKYADPCTAFVPGDLVQFKPISKKEFKTYA